MLDTARMMTKKYANMMNPGMAKANMNNDMSNADSKNELSLARRMLARRNVCPAYTDTEDSLRTRQTPAS